MMTITYPVHNGIYVNMTNRCPCACTFCLRKQSDHVFEIKEQLRVELLFFVLSQMSAP